MGGGAAYVRTKPKAPAQNPGPKPWPKTRGVLGAGTTRKMGVLVAYITQKGEFRTGYVKRESVRN